uniref:Uncharacterized protein n=1 Tax=Arundo donax TaxID=35708 RepID=A0A0A9CD07_ARUDO
MHFYGSPLYSTNGDVSWFKAIIRTIGSSAISRKRLTVDNRNGAAPYKIPQPQPCKVGRWTRGAYAVCFAPHGRRRSRRSGACSPGPT